jgi:glycosyltransferase involved in cell wall biosynthesis
VVIVSNDTKFLSETLDSVLNQTHSFFEVLLVLNGSATDEIDFYKEFFLRNEISGRVLISEIEGIVRARNLGIMNARFDLICTIDSDDVMPPKRIEEQVKEFVRNPNLVCLGGQLDYIGEHRKLEGFRYPTSNKHTIHSLFRQASLPQPGSMFLKSKFEEVGGYRETHPYIEDWDLWLRFCRAGEIYNLDSPTVGYRLHANQSTKIHKEVIKKSSINLLFENLEIIVRKNSSMPSSPDVSWRKQVLRESLAVFMCIREGQSSVRKRDIRRSIAGIVYQMYISRLAEKKYLSSTYLGLLSTLIDPRILENRALNTYIGRKIAPRFKF